MVGYTLQVLQGSYAVCPSIRQQDLEPINNCLGVAGGVSHLHSLPDGQETQAEEWTALQVGVPVVLQHPTGVWHGHHFALH
jgi:hypothetical protein